MDAQVGIPTELSVPLDEQAQEVVMLAAQLGAQLTDDEFVSYTTLLLGVLFAKLDHGQSQPDGTLSVNDGPAWQVEAKQALKVADILSQKSGLNHNMADNLASAVRSGQVTSWPSGRPLLSISARNVLQDAARLASEKRGPQVSVTPADMMASYLTTIPVAHQRQAESWGLTGPGAQRIRVLLTTPGSSEAEAGDLPGFDVAASAVVKAAFVLAGRWRTEKRVLLSSETLLVALAETAGHIATDDAAAATMLRDLLRVGELNSTYVRRRNTTFDMPEDLAGAAASVGIQGPPLSDNARLILQAARGLAARLSRSEIVSIRHLLAALICNPDGTNRSSVAAEWLSEAGVTPDRLGVALIDVVRARHANDNQVGWRDLLIGPDVSVVSTARPDTIPDDPRAADTLGLRRYADAIGALICASDQKPPLSIAVFGSWGSGKSFFMAMIRAAVKDFAVAGADAFKAAKPTPFLRRVVHIEFNAWHYAEGNLWASLVHAILVGLQDALTQKDQRSVFQQVLDQLHLRQAAQAEAEAALRETEQRLAESRAALEKMEHEVQARRAQEASVLSAADVITAVQREALAALKPPGQAVTAQAWIKSVSDSAIKVADYLGRPELAEQVPALRNAASDAAAGGEALQVTVGDVRDLLDEAQASATRGLSLLGWLANARVEPHEQTKLLLLGGGGLAGIVMVALPLALWANQIAGAISATAAFMVSVVGPATIAVNWGRRHLREATRAFAVLGSIRERVEAQQVQRLAARDAELLVARRATAEAEAEAARRRADVEAARVAVANAKEELKAATSPERLKQFVAQRLAEGDYQRHLGLIHTIRGDLERLRDILKGVHLQEAAVTTEAPVQRIVLYIDDLDRCPPARVVEVLEAVHLLLAFPLFVVVVGVDIRWVAQALRRRYPLQLGDRPGVASPVDYLEKVFQIPFWLPAMDPLAGERLLEAAIGPARPRQTGRSIDQSESSGQQDPGTEQHSTERGKQESSDQGETGPPPRSEPPPDGPVDTQEVAQALVLEELERQRIVGMAAAVGASPRRANRFANLYRLLKASLAATERRGFVLEDGKGGSYTGALILLAAATGAPRATRALITRLEEAPGADLDEYLQSRFSLEVPPEEKRAFDAVKALALATRDKAALVRHLRDWAPGVMRFVFDAPD